MKQKLKKLLVVALTLAFTIAALPQTAQTVEAQQVSASELIGNPQEADDGVVTWDCVWFGSYPQSEVTNLTAAITGATYDDNGDATVDGVKYRRIKESDATYSSTSRDYYNWNIGGDSNGYHYFKYEPIKWRVLSVNGNDAFLLADVGLDNQRYHNTYTSITWENCTMRTFLNGKFLNSAFSSAQQGAIYDTHVVNDNNPYETEGGNDTTDKVYLLSRSEIINPTYGFHSNRGNGDPARRSKTSDYAHAMGAYNSTTNSSLGNCWWWLRSPGYGTYSATVVIDGGYVDGYGSRVNYYVDALRPALHLNLSSSNLYYYAGTVSSDGTKNEKGYYDITIDDIVVATVGEGSEYELPATAQIGYYKDGEIYKAGSSITVTSDMAFTSVNELSVSMTNGASIKTSTPTGMRFMATVTSDNMEAVSSETAIKAGMLISANDLVENFGDGILDKTSTYVTKDVENSGWFQGHTGTYCAAIVGMHEANYIREFVARAYATVTYSDGTNKTYYSDMGPVRSVSNVAKAVQADNGTGLSDAEKLLVYSFIR